jgi:hypothetical protein
MRIQDNLVKFIIANYNQEALFAKYLQIPLDVIEDSLQRKVNIHNVHRQDDSSPSLRLYYRDNKLRMWDYGNALYRGDIFDLVGLVLSKNTTDSKSFIEICNHIISNEKLGEASYIVPKVRDVDITYTLKQHSKQDKHYWYSGGITTSHLINRGIHPATNVKVNGFLYATYTTDNPVYVYLDGTVNNTEIVKIYQPFGDKSNKFRTNNKLFINKSAP